MYHLSEYFQKYPNMPEELANFMVAKQVKIIGVDAPSPDRKPWPAHKILLKNEILIIENLTNLKELRDKEFKVYAFPAKYELDGAPVRVVAETYS